MILYFTGTGNSRYIAHCLGQALEDTVVSLNDVLRSGQRLSLHSDTPYIIVAPIHAWRYPGAVEGLLQDAELRGSRQVYCIAAMGENSGNADKALKKLFTAKGMDFRGFCGVVMPNNYIAGWDVDSPDRVRQMLTEGRAKTQALAGRMRAGETIAGDDRTPLGWLMSGAVNYGFRNFMLKNQVLTVSDACVGCGECAAFCPMGNIAVTEGRAVMGGSCMSCYGCIHRCPTRAINIPGKTEHRGRYVCPDFE